MTDERDPKANQPPNEDRHRGTKRRPRLERLGNALADARSIDWDAQRSDSPELGLVVEQLKQLEALRQAHRVIAQSFAGEVERSHGLFRWGPLLALELIGEGAFGQVYRALDTRLQREVALKLRRVDEGAAVSSDRRFLEEARSLARIRHSNVLVVHGADVHDTDVHRARAGFWTDFIRGETVAALLAETGPFAIEEVARIGVALCRALAAVHSAGLIHGDVKATNVMREAGGRILLMDFGAVSRLARSESTDPGVAAAFGSPLVLAPEVLRGESPRASSDLYSLGVLLYQLVSGSLPISAETWPELLRAHEAGDRVPLRDRRPELPEAFVRVVETSLEPDPSARYGSAAEMERALRLAMPSVTDPDESVQTLRSVLDELGRVPEEMCRQIGREAARALLGAGPAGAAAEPLSLDALLIHTDGTVSFAGDAVRGADLSLLGRILYELAVGEPPAAADEVDRAKDLSPFFREVVHQLLHGNDVSSGTAGIAAPRDLLRVLSEGERGAWWRERLRAIRLATPPPLRRLRIPRDTAIQGRTAELDALERAYSRVEVGDGQVVLLDGEAGIGKTRLVDEFVGLLWRGGAEPHFLFGAYPPGDGATAAEAFLTAYRDHLGEDALEDTLREYLGAAPLLIAPFAALLRGESGAAAAGAFTRDSLQTAFVRLTQALAAERPTVVLIDDLHFAPAEGRNLFTALALAAPGHRILLIGCTRPGSPGDWSADLARPEHCSRLRLQRLSPSHVEQILAEVLDSRALAEELAPDLAVRSDGNPLFLLENLRALEEAGLLARDARGPSAASRSLRDVPIPSTIQHLIQARFAALADEDKELIDVASCAGFEFDPALVAAALGLPVLPALKRFAVIERHAHLIRSAGRRYVFDHHQVQEALYGGLFEQLREQYHAALATALEARERATEHPPQELEGSIAVALAEHYFKGRRDSEALRYLVAALDHLAGTYQNEAALWLANVALESRYLSPGRLRYEVLGRKASRLSNLGRPRDEQATLEEMLLAADESGELGPKARARGMLGYRYVRDGRIEEAHALLDEAVRFAEESGDASEQGYTRSVLGGLLLSTGRHEEAIAAYTLGVAFSREAGNGQFEANATGNLGAVLYTMGRYEEARHCFEQSLAVSQEAGFPLGEANAIGNLGAVYDELGQYEMALTYHRRHLTLSRQIGYRQGEAAAREHLGAANCKLGRTAEALSQLERATALFREVGFKLGQTNAIGQRGHVLSMLGAHEDARAHFEEALALCREIRSPRAEGVILLGLGYVAAQSGDLPAAERWYREALELGKAMDDRPGRARALSALGALLGRNERTEEARDRLTEAIALAQEFDTPRTLVLAEMYLAMLPGGALIRPSEAIVEQASLLDAAEQIEVRYLLWRVTADRTHLEEAHRLLLELRSQAPEADRDTMLERVPLYREVVAAMVA